MDGGVLAENIVVADAETRGFVFVFQILRRVADDAAGVELVVRADFRLARQINVRPDGAMRAEFHARVNHGERRDADGRVQFRLRMDDGGWMNHLIKVEQTTLLPSRKNRQTSTFAN
jgi:hypothetical protein